eukprot:gene11872-biopygen4148
MWRGEEGSDTNDLMDVTVDVLHDGYVHMSSSTAVGREAVSSSITIRIVIAININVTSPPPPPPAPALSRLLSAS